jgi:hypothetical protein
VIKLALSHIVAALAVVATVVAPTVGAKEPPKGTSSITLPERQNDIPAFVAELDDKQARSTLVKVLEERTKPAVRMAWQPKGTGYAAHAALRRLPASRG